MTKEYNSTYNGISVIYGNNNTIYPGNQIHNNADCVCQINLGREITMFNWNHDMCLGSIGLVAVFRIKHPVVKEYGDSYSWE